MKDAVALIQRSDRIFVASHVSPDGDAIGSLLALGWALEKLGKEVTLACSDPVPENFTYLPGSDRIAADHPDDDDLIISIDASDLTRLGDIYDRSQFSDKLLLNIDHHVTNDGFGDVNVIDTQAVSTTQILTRLIDKLGLKLDPRIATCLLNGLVTDTLGFRTTNVTPEALELGSRLMRAGGPLADIADQVFYRKPLPNVRMWGKIIESLQVEDRIAWARNTQAMRRAVGAGPDEDSGGVRLLASVAEADVALLLKEREDGKIEVSMRSRANVDLTLAAVRLGGGGHPQAAGALIPGPLSEAEEKTLRELRQSMTEQDEDKRSMVRTF